MKKKIQPKSHHQLIKKYPITDLVEGWYFSLNEVSAGAYSAEGTDIYGREVSCSGIDEKELLNKCKTMAIEINNKIKAT